MAKLPFLPKALRELMDYISPLAFEVIDWQSIVKASSPLIKQMVTGKGVKELCAANGPLLPKGLSFHSGMGSGIKFNTSELAAVEALTLGNRILEYYFQQFKAEQGIFIDLRLSRFRRLDQEAFSFKPNGMWTTLSPEFREGVIDMYCGFYHDDNFRYERGLASLGMTPEHLDETKKEELKTLLQEHFGEGRNQEVPFSIKKFSKSFHQMFDFFLKNRIRLHGEFLFLGLYLVTLYLALDQLGRSFDVRGAFQRAFPPPSQS